MAKRLFITLLALTIAAAAFAEGQKEQQQGPFQGDKVVLKGTVSLQNNWHPVLKSGDKQYVLMVPPWLVERSGVKEGAQVTVQGYQTRGMPYFGADANNKYVGLFVTQATVDGKDYDLSRYYGGMMMGGRGRGFGPGYGRGYGMMGGGYGPGYGMMGGRGYGPGYGPGCGGFGPGAGDGDDQ